MSVGRFMSSFGVFDDGAAGHREQDHALGARGADVAEAVVTLIEQSKALDALGQTVGSLVSSVLQPGKVKDLVSGTWMGHPAHPMLTDIPVGTWTSALVLDLLGGPGAAKGADTLVGIGVLAALPTAITGLSELADLGTEHERAIAAAHAIGISAAVALYAASYVARNSGSRMIGVGLSTAATGLLTASAFLGGHLSFRKGIGVNHTAFEYPVD